MSATIVVGGQFGGEGKGAVTAYLHLTREFACVVKTGGPNAWHNYGLHGQMHDVRMLPSGTTLRPTTIVFPPGSLIYVPTLLAELDRYSFQGNVLIDPLAGLIDEVHIQTQKADDFYLTTGSSRRGTGAASAQRSLRRLPVAREDSRLKHWLFDTARYLESVLSQGRDILVEGGQWGRR